jgi:hypothetical protein
MLVLILCALAALGFGVWLGLPGRPPSVEDVERNMRHPLPRSRKAKRHFTLLAWAQRRIGGSGSRPDRGFRGGRPDRG